MKALDVEFRLPFYSIKHLESYQVGISYYSIFPSTLVGAIGYSLALNNQCYGDSCKNEAQKIIKKAREYFVNSNYPLLIKFPIILKRLRKKKEKSNKKEDKKLDADNKKEDLTFDAMVREYVYSDRKSVIFLGELEKIEKVIYNIDRIGDSESLISLSYVNEIDLRECESNEVNVIIKKEIWNLEGNHIMSLGLDENWNKSLFVLPLYSKDNKGYYSETKINGKTLCSDDGRVKIPAGDDW